MEESKHLIPIEKVIDFLSDLSCYPTIEYDNYGNGSTHIEMHENEIIADFKKYCEKIC